MTIAIRMTSGLMNQTLVSASAGPARAGGYELMQTRDDLCTITYSRSDALSRSRTDVAYSKHTWATRFNGLTLALQDVAASKHKPFPINRDTRAVEPC